MNTLFTIGIFLCFFLAILLFSKKSQSLPDRVLGVWLTCIGIYLLNYYLHYLGYWEKYPHLVGVTHPFPMLFAPFLYLYVSVCAREDQRFHWRDTLHFLPFVIGYIAMFPFLFGYSAEEKAITDSADYHSDYQWFFTLSFIAFVVVSGVYFVLAYRKINHYERVIGENFGYNEGISLQWLQLLLLGFVAIVAVLVTVYVVEYSLEIDTGFNIEILFFALFILLIFLIGFWGIRYQGIFGASRTGSVSHTGGASHTGSVSRTGGVTNLSDKSDSSDKSDGVDNFNTFEEETKAPEYRKSGLKAEEAPELHQQLLQLMQTEKPYLEPKLSLAQLAEILGVLPNHLSQIINQYEAKNFYDFVNSYRVEEFIALAKKDTDKNFNLLGLAFEASFNSKSSFNQVFKKFKGKTPSEFLS
jgi:putative transcriptional regulator, araC family